MKRNAEWKLILEARKGNPEAWNKLYATHQKKVFNIIYSIVRELGTAEDLCQDTFIKVHENLKKFKGKSAFSTWVHRIAVNMALMHVRKKGLHIAGSVEDFDFPTFGLHTDGKVIQSSAITKAMSRLSPKRKLAIVWKMIEGCTHKEIAARLGITAAGSKSLIHHGFIQMRRSLIKQGFNRGDYA